MPPATKTFIRDSLNEAISSYVLSFIILKRYLYVKRLKSFLRMILNLFIRNTKVTKLFIIRSLYFLIACSLLPVSSLQAQLTPVPRQDPRFVSEVNPLRNTYINPQLTSNINPKFNSKLNPNFNTQIHPAHNPLISPDYDPNINPNFNPDLNPLYNAKLDPAYGARPAFFIYTASAEPAGFAMEAIEGRVYLYYDAKMEYKGFFVSNSVGGYNLFGADTEFSGQYFTPNGQGNFNFFNMSQEWLGFTAP